MKKPLHSLLLLGAFLTVAGWLQAQTPVPMASQNGLVYVENFNDISNWSNNFTSGVGASRWKGIATGGSGSIPAATRITTATTSFSTGTTGGVQKGNGNIVLLSTGSTENSSSAAIDLYLNFTGVNAGSISFNWQAVSNSTGNRPGSLRIYTTTDGNNFTELTTAGVLDVYNNSNTSGTISNVSLPASFNNSATARIRFYYHNGSAGTGSGSRPKISIDDLTITATTGCTAPTTPSSNISISGIRSNGANLSWNAGNGDGSMLVLRPAQAASVLPSSGTAYTANTSYSLAGQINADNRVVFRDAGTSVNDISELSPATSYTATVYEYNNTLSCYATTNAPSASFYTYSTEPQNHASAFNATAAAYNQVNLSFSAFSTIPNASGYIILQKVNGTPTALPTDGQAYALQSTLGDATVAAIITAASQVSQSITSLNATTSYSYTLIPFNWDGTHTATYNYYTEAAIPFTSATTLMGPSNLSDITDNGSPAFYTSNIDYTQYQATTINNIGTGSNGSLAVMSLLLRDGGSAGTDPDNYATELTALTLSYTGATNTIKSAALFDGSTKIADAAVSGNTLTFSGLTNVSAADDGTRELTLAVSFNTAVTDNDKLVFTVTGVTAGNAGSTSQFSAADGGGASSDNTSNDYNRIAVTAGRIAFTTQPVSVNVNVPMVPAPVVSAVDIYGNTDVDFTGAVSVTSSGTLANTPLVNSLSNGSAVFTNITHTATGTNLHLAAAAGSFPAVTSNTFIIDEIPYATGDYRTTGNGSWPGGSSAASWEQLTVNGWQSGTPPSSNYTGGKLYIRHTITSSAVFGTPAFVILEGARLTVTHNATIAAAHVYSGGIFEAAGPITISSSATPNFILDSAATLIINTSTIGSMHAFWNGNENFKPKSNTIIYNWKYTGSSGDQRIINPTPQISLNEKGYYFGHLTFEGTSTSAFSFTQIGNGNTYYLCSDNLTVDNRSSFSTALNNSSASANIYIGGNLTTRGNSFAFFLTNSTNSPAAHIQGDLFLEATTNNIQQQSNNSVVTSINIHGDLVIGNGATLSTGNNNADRNYINFANKGEQHIRMNGGTLSASHMTLQVQDSSITKLGTDLATSTNTRIIVLSGGTFHTNTYNVTGTGSFSDTSGGHLVITSPDGIWSGGTQGNIQTATRLFSSNGIYEYAGSIPQVTGTALPANAGRLIINNAAGISLTQATAVNDGIELRSGLLSTTASNILTLNESAMVTGGDHTSYVDGPVRAKTAHTSPVLLPVGNNNRYAPVQITAAGATPVTYLAAYFNGSNITVNSTSLGSSSLSRVDSFQYWDISRPEGTENAYITLPFDGSSALGSLANAVVAHYNTASSNWESAGQIGTSGTVSGGTVTSGLVSSFSPFTIGDLPATPLFIELAAFDVTRTTDGVAIRWQTAREDAGDVFQVEHSTGDNVFTGIASIPAKGSPSSYQVTDRSYREGTNLYRLRLLHNDGTYTYSTTRLIFIAPASSGIVLYPNPAADILHIRLSLGGDGSLLIAGAAGREVYQAAVTAPDHISIDISQWAPGTYFVQYRINGQSYHTKFIKQ
ncbi:MAG: hypothetical protein BGO09_16230 [Bacteroidetes bacterium 47-18]|nr:MAG: hypothetical protein BGO09_16230 [Bacteroidetes bacterium 47-18]